MTFNDKHHKMPPKGIFTMTRFFVLMILLGSCAHHAHRHHRFDDAEKWAGIFEHKKRDKWQHPDQVIVKLNINKNAVIADIGSATGYFPVRLAKTVSEGRVWAMDIEPNLVNYLNKRARNEKLNNLYSILGTPADPLLPQKVDFVFVVNTFHHIEHRGTYFKNLKKRYMKAKAKLVIIDFKKVPLPIGPRLEMKLTEKQVVNELEEAGFRVEDNHKILPYQYFLVFK